MTATDPAPEAQLAPYVGRWALDVARSSFGFRTKAMWVLPVKGSVDARSGSAEVTGAGSVVGELVLDATSLRTGMGKRDAHLQTADFLDTATHPTFDFALTGAEMASPGHARVTGTLTILGRARPVSFDAEVTADATTATLQGAIDDLDRSDWGVSWSKMGAGLHNQVTFTATFTKA